MNIKMLLEKMIELGASDLHIKPGISPVVRVNGKLQRTSFPAPTPRQMEETARKILTPLQREKFESTREVDFAFGVTGLARFRANFYVQRSSIAMVFRHVPVSIPTIEELNLPLVIGNLALRPRGLILVTGTVGSGKSTTLAAMVQTINRNLPSTIITIEDPVEFLHRDDKSIINQREVGSDTSSFHEALRHILRQDPDVILIGEIRDAETMEIALKAADTGHLVLSTLHTVDATQTVNRVISFFPPHQHQEIRYLLASTVQAVICQRLIRRIDSEGRIPAVEVMVTTGTIRDCLVNPDKTQLIQQVMREGVTQHQMQTFDQALMRLFQEGKINIEDALRASSNPHELTLRLKGIQATSDQTWKGFEDVTSNTVSTPEV
ncbi:MAG: PilT/PilU family type 4a pilus ATPase [Candidatus Latescibacteria bacterium]|nr:PilT/PilU family type 4a pilus ATPase [Candidatus Latescibacterota bacterium]NIM20962.1 PilT/PilU family type 4a pilus ATPase [Candidatus Latescibacterota bacterium]NIM65097.1 PilT/PilU family type 4a pilus ATPase [Candidatus Latescibacterota bacterium]NIO01612.1 PilT/PilU family type 4a pilus ATPase [Candidatus Latescibacterota bacterium]NIO28129.1 PilT/PilU family type 4a pilus ATPase [Candidatus Latescibacterota bacterium]